MYLRQAALPVRMSFFLLLSGFSLLLFLYKGIPAKTPAYQAASASPPGTGEEKGGDLRPAEWFFAAREYPDFYPDINMYAQAIAQARYAAQQRGGAPGFSAPWTVQGPGNIGARVTTIKVHPINRDVIYIGYSHGGVWKTTDGGSSWFPVFDDQPFLAIGDIELDPQDPETVYVGTGDPDISGYPFIGDGVWKSTNGGQTWAHFGLENQRIISKIIVHPTNSGILYAAAMGLPFERNTDRGLYKTTDGGQSWQQVLFISDSTGVIDLVMAPGNPNVLYAAAWDRIRNNQESLVSGNNARIWKTEDGGATWAILNGGLPQDESSRIGLSIDALNDQHVAAIYAGSDLEFRGVFQTFDGGQTWQESPTSGLDPGFQGGFAWYFGKIFINPFDPMDIYICGVDLWRSTDGGQNWFQTTPQWWLYEVHADKHDMAFIDASTCLLATDGGLYESFDSGFTWTKIENIPTSQFYRVAYNPFVPDWYFGGMQDNGTSGGNAGNSNEWPRLFGGDGFQPLFHPENPDIFYFETQNGNIRGTTDGGASFEDATEGIDGDDRRHWDMPYIMSSHNSDLFYTGTYRVYLGFGHPPVWSPFSDDLTDGDIFGGRFHTISTLSDSPLDPDLLYVGTTDGNVWQGNPFAPQWANISAGLPDRYVSSVKASPSLPDRVYAAHTGYKSNDFTPHLHRSDDRGASWVAISGDLPNLAINDILILPGHQDSILFVGTDGGVFGTLDAGQHWERLGTGMPLVPVYDLDLNPERHTLIAGTYARSIMTFPLDSLQTGGNVSAPDPAGPDASHLTVAPNPAHTAAQVILDNLPAQYPTEIYLLDGSGRLMWQSRVGGETRTDIQIPVEQIPSGVYFVFARTNGTRWGQQKLIISR